MRGNSLLSAGLKKKNRKKKTDTHTHTHTQPQTKNLKKDQPNENKMDDDRPQETWFYPLHPGRHWQLVSATAI